MSETFSELAARKGMTSRQVVAAMEVAGAQVHVNTVERWLAGAGLPQPKVLLPLASALGEEVGVVLEACNASVSARKASEAAAAA